MSKIFLFMMITLDGFMEGPDHDISWHHVDEEFNEFASKQMMDIGTILFGKRTYELMKAYWPTETPSDPGDKLVAGQMNTLPKIVYSTTLDSDQETENWKNITIKQTVNADEIKQLKEKSTKDIGVLGSNNLCVTLLEKRLLDELRIMINPVVIGNGTLLFEGIKKKLDLKLTKTRNFKNGNILLTYTPQYEED